MTPTEFHSLLWLDDHTTATCAKEETVGGITGYHYKPVFSDKGTIIVLSHATAHIIHQKITRLVLKNLDEKDTNIFTPTKDKDLLYINPISFLDRALKSLTRHLDSGQTRKDPLVCSLLKCGWTCKTLTELLPKIKSLVSNFFKLMHEPFERSSTPVLNPYYISTATNKKKLEQWENRMAYKVSRYLYRESGFRLLGDVSLSEEAMEKLHFKEDYLPRMSCFEYALATADIETASCYYSDKWPVGKRFESTLIHMGWKSVSQPKTHDLVVYYDQFTNEIVHAAIYTENGKAISKPGNLFHGIVEHDIFEFCGCYGSTLFFMRKSSS